jgi:hypothetical protein
MNIIFNIIWIKLKIDVNNNKILKTKWERDMKKSLNVIGGVQQHGAQVNL